MIAEGMATGVVIVELEVPKARPRTGSRHPNLVGDALETAIASIGRIFTSRA
jgi:hypothetical protein